jgi:hypothetical protein
LAHDRDKRYATALECQTDLDQLCERLGYLVKHKAIGTFVSELFVEHQSQVREIVELQLSRSSLASMRPPPMPDDSSPPSSEVGGHSIATKTAPRRRRWPFVLLAAALTASALVLPRVIVSRSPEVAKAEGKAKPSDLPKAVHVAAPEPVKEATIRFIVSPRETRLLLNETPLSDHTTELRLPVDGKEHTLRAEAEGYESKSLPFTVTEDAALDLTLVKSSSKPGKATIRPRLPTTPRRAAAPVDAPTRATAAHEKPTTPACNDPFFIDAAGIKRVRPECR